MSRKENLPESLELLLDTMCNTFGGIMFIAMSLIVISQLVTKEQVEKTPEEISKEQIAKIEQNISKLNAEILMLKQRALEARFKVPADISAEKSAALKKLQAIAKQNLQQQAQLDKEMQKSDVLNAKIRSVRRSQRDAAAALAKEQNAQRQESSRLNRHKHNAAQMVAYLRAKLAQTKSRTFTFAMERTTFLNAYWVIIHKNRVHRMDNSAECRKIPNGERMVRIEPLQGTRVTGNSDEVFDRIFQNVSNSSSFISVASDDESFETLQKLRVYARKRGYKFSWSVDNSYQFYYGATSHQASE